MGSAANRPLVAVIRVYRCIPGRFRQTCPRHVSCSERGLQLARQGAALAVIVAMVATCSGCGGIDHHRTRHEKHLARIAVAFALAQIGKPYLFGGNGPDAYDCSGLATASWDAAGVWLSPGVSRPTSQSQYSDGTQVSDPLPGDLVFFAGADGTASSPGHVGIIIDPVRHLMVEAYAPGTTIRIAYYDSPKAPQGDTNSVGITDPTAAITSAYALAS